MFCRRQISIMQLALLRMDRHRCLICTMTHACLSPD